MGLFSKTDLRADLHEARSALRTQEEQLLHETKRILSNDLFSDQKILENLGRYNSSFTVITEEEADHENLFTLNEIKRVAINHRLKFLEAKHYKPEIPYEAISKIKQLNKHQGKELKEFRVLSRFSAFSKTGTVAQSALFVKTNHDNYYLIHRWGGELPWYRKLLCWPFRSFETLAIAVIVYTLALTLALPTWAITLDSKATYWSGYRGGVFFHLLIFNSAFTTLIFSAFARNFSGVLWARKNNFD